MLPLIAIRAVVFVLSGTVVVLTVLSAIRTFVLPRSAPDMLTRLVFLCTRYLFNLRLRWAHTYEARDGIMAFYAPVSLLALPPAWLALICLGYTGMYWALGVEPLSTAFTLSGSSLFTLGFTTAGNLFTTILVFSEASFGLMLIALLISYMPTIYAAFSRREVAVNMLEVRAGSPPSAVEMIARFHRLHGLDRLGEMWRSWENWFVELEETHTSLPVLAFFRSPVPNRSWITAAGTVLDAASLCASTVDVPRDIQTDLCIRAGHMALRYIADFFGIAYDPDPKPTDPIRISHLEFDAAYDLLKEQGVPLKPDRDQAWRDFAGWRVNYDAVLLALCALVMAPEAPWSSDRAPEFAPPSLFAVLNWGHRTKPPEGHP